MHWSVGNLSTAQVSSYCRKFEDILLLHWQDIRAPDIVKVSLSVMTGNTERHHGDPLGVVWKQGEFTFTLCIEDS